MSSSSTTASSNKGKGQTKGSGSVQTHNVQHTMRAASKQKTSQRQAAQAQAQAQTQGEASASGSGKAPSVAAPTVPRKQVFKQVLASPLTVNWPAVSDVDVQPVLYTLLDVLKHPAVAGYLRGAEGKGKGKAPEASDTSTQLSKSDKVPLTLGINSVSRHLESMIDYEAKARHEKTPATRPTPLNIVFVCRSDLDPPTLCAHFPMLTCAVNAVCHGRSQSQAAGLLLIPLPSGSERLISDTLQLRRCSVLALSTDTLADLGLRDPLLALLARIQEVPSLKPLRAAWLDSAADVALRTRQYLKGRASAVDSAQGPVVMPKVKQVSTTAPTNLNAVKLNKKHTRQEKKEWRKNVRKQGHIACVAQVKRDKNKMRKVRSKERVKAGKEQSAKKKVVEKPAKRAPPPASARDVEMKDAAYAHDKL